MFKLHTVLIVLLATAFFGAADSHAQKTKPKPPARLEVDHREAMPEFKDWAYVVDIDKNSNIMVRVQNSEDVESLSNTANAAPISKFFSDVKDKKFTPIVIVRLGTPANWGDTLDVLQKIRDTSPLKMKAEIDPGNYVFIPMPWVAGISRPNPLTLVVNVQKDSRVFLNIVDVCKLDDLSKLRDRLIKIFKDREAQGVFRVGSNEVDTTVYFKADRATKFDHVIDVIRTIRSAGSTRVGLYLMPDGPPEASMMESN